MAASLILVGCGRMGNALLSGWLDRGLDPDQIAVVEPEPDNRAMLSRRPGLAVAAGPEGLSADLQPEVVVFAVKPQMMDAVAPAYARFTAADAVFLSIAAGRNAASLAAALGNGAAIVRAMPNTPAAIRRGITAAYRNAGVNERQRQRCHDLLAAVGDVVWIEDERLMDAVTAVSGSGPAYVFLLVEALADAGIAAGLSPELAGRLARATVSGAAGLLDASDAAPETLRRNVTSPGGTTAAALEVLMASGGLRTLMTAAVRAAADRSRQLES